MRNIIGIAVAAAFVLGGISVSSDPASARSFNNQNSGTSDGSACVVTSGPHKGQKGVYTTDERGEKFCESALIAVGCGMPGKPSRCKPAVHSSTGPGGVYRPFPSATHQIPSGTWSAGNVSTLPGASTPSHSTRYPTTTFGTKPILELSR